MANWLDLKMTRKHESVCPFPSWISTLSQRRICNDCYIYFTRYCGNDEKYYEKYIPPKHWKGQTTEQKNNMNRRIKREGYKVR